MANPQPTSVAVMMADVFDCIERFESAHRDGFVGASLPMPGPFEGFTLFYRPAHGADEHGFGVFVRYPDGSNIALIDAPVPVLLSGARLIPRLVSALADGRDSLRADVTVTVRELGIERCL